MATGRQLRRWTGQEHKLASDQDWLAISTRDRRSDGRFVWVALSTYIYCRPSCGARRPARRRVVVLPTAVLAERQGYSACRRCRPEATTLSGAEASIAVALAYIRTHPDSTVTLRSLSRVVGLSPNHLQRLFTRVVGMSPRDYRDHRRLARLKELLRDGTAVTDAAYAAGYGSIRALYEKGSRNLGMTPATYRRGGAGARIRYAIFDSSNGRVLVADTDLGLCTVLVGERDQSLVAEISRELPEATLICELDPPAAWGATVRACAPADPLLSTLPFQVRRDIFRARMMKVLTVNPPLGGGEPTGLSPRSGRARRCRPALAAPSTT
jgi:AraC family transcriptional regulator of adaptative response/methylated-DNA-[protein]-cysteine methyltransferase